MRGDSGAPGAPGPDARAPDAHTPDAKADGAGLAPTPAKYPMLRPTREARIVGPATTS